MDDNIINLAIRWTDQPYYNRKEESAYDIVRHILIHLGVFDHGHVMQKSDIINNTDEIEEEIIKRRLKDG